MFMSKTNEKLIYLQGRQPCQSVFATLVNMVKERLKVPKDHSGLGMEGIKGHHSKFMPSLNRCVDCFGANLKLGGLQQFRIM